MLLCVIKGSDVDLQQEPLSARHEFLEHYSQDPHLLLAFEVHVGHILRSLKPGSPLHWQSFAKDLPPSRGR